MIQTPAFTLLGSGPCSLKGQGKKVSTRPQGSPVQKQPSLPGGSSLATPGP